MRTPTMIFLAALSLAGCARIPTHQGFIADKALIAAVQPGVDNRASVEKTLGRPTFTGQFNGDNIWYYVSRMSKQYAYTTPRPTEQTVVRIGFDAAGNVTSVNQSGVERVVAISPSRDKTPTLGRDRNFLQEIFGNIGQVGAVGQGGASQDNPNGD